MLWFDGYWERLIGLTKMAVKKTPGRAHINLVTLKTIIVKVEVILNDCSLTNISDDLADTQLFTCYMVGDSPDYPIRYTLMCINLASTKFSDFVY